MVLRKNRNEIKNIINVNLGYQHLSHVINVRYDMLELIG